jgi:hypothetical protein
MNSLVANIIFGEWYYQIGLLIVLGLFAMVIDALEKKKTN